MWADNETDIDLLGFRVHSDLVRSIVTDATLLPLTVGIFGDWGSGKSSVMKMLAHDLESEEGVAHIYFNGWQFEGYDDAKSALIHSILLELGEHKKLAPNIKSKAASVLKRVNWLRVANAGYQTIIAPIIAYQVATMMGIQSGMTPMTPRSPVPEQDDLQNVDLTELLKENPANQGIIGARRFREDFESLIKETKLKAMVILIDDLDRCEPQRLVETLEAIKLFLAVPHVSFVISADDRIVRYSIAKRYEIVQVEEEEGKPSRQIDLVTDYLEKLIQIPYHLPRLSPSEIETYISLLYSQLHLSDDFTVAHNAFTTSRKESITSVFRHQEIQAALTQSGKKCPDQLTADLVWCNSVALSLSDILKGNPRQTKRLLNALRLRQRLAQAAGLRLMDQVLVKLMLLEYMQPRLFAQLYKWQAVQQGFPTELKVLEQAVNGGDETAAQKIIEQDSKWASATVKAWLQMQPPLAETDLRDYFWITRDRITDILSGVAGIPLNLRRLLSEVFQTEDGILLPEIKNQIGQLSADEQSAFFEELAASLLRNPSQPNLVRAWLDAVTVAPIGGHKLLNVLIEIPVQSIPATTPLAITHMAQRYPDTREKTITLLRDWQSKPDTLLGRASTEALKDLMKVRR